MVTNEHPHLTLEAARTVGPGQFACVGNISCDIEGELEFLPRHSTPSELFSATRPRTRPRSRSWLSTSCPRHSRSTRRSTSRTCFSYACARSYAATATRAKALERATVAQGGVLREEHRWLETRSH